MKASLSQDLVMCLKVNINRIFFKRQNLKLTFSIGVLQRDLPPGGSTWPAP